MKTLHTYRLFLFMVLPALSFSVFISCNKKETFLTDKITDYLPLAPGKYITYRVDSMVFTNFGRSTEIRKYQVRHLVDALITDNLGRPAYRIFRFIRDSAGTQPWQANGTYLMMLLNDKAEMTEDNLRVIKLQLPIKDKFTWKGNRYLPDNPYGPLYNFSNDDNMADWDFYYDGNPSSFSYRGVNYNNVITVEQANEVLNVPITNPNAYAALTRCVDRYAKGTGLVFRHFEIWEYQPNPGGTAGPYKTGFGITMWMIDKN
ncbi:MAG: hypothetical protein N2747_07275 [Chitinophagaceae bacterium]|nr:hypothetical protein [Chitinophagaceae bacterium]